MRRLINEDTEHCVACNRCVRVCPVDGGNIAAMMPDGKIKVSVNYERCVACGSCIYACHHGVRDYDDDTHRFLSDLERGANISLIVAPANRISPDGGRLLTWLKRKGVRKIYDVSLGADICTWAHIRFIERDKPASVITQPCPAIVNYIQHFEHGLVKYLSPVHSPMLCTAIYMKHYEMINDSVAALSPCIAKTHEFDATQFVKYNVTLKHLYKYIRDNNIELPREETGFDHMESAYGRLYCLPGGLKENMVNYFGKGLRIDQCEGSDIVYKALSSFATESAEFLPTIFDVLNCAEGCNLGTAIDHECSRFEASHIIAGQRNHVIEEFDSGKYDEMLGDFDKRLNLNNFMRRYAPIPIKKYNITDHDIEKCFEKLNKFTEVDKIYDCGACGKDTCKDMVLDIIRGFDIPDNCIKMLHDIATENQTLVMDIATSNVASMNLLTTDIGDIIDKSSSISNLVNILNEAILKYKKIATDIVSLSSHTNLISLNAAIEAARAGQHGRAFAVVAEEIRQLANKSKNTVSESEDISKQAMDSIKSIIEMTDSITTDIEKAHISINIVHQSLNNIIEKEKK
ncbi:MAG: methyl-accepting chemotaxis protein [Defluviitaleaceae bacterium]|nr:methyl-accepting chemotaxis protein [Defluviitaleaceae bacterium]MCL2239229.1 methyl-accepting chemotaxis protein [Defluviitaleaceae bacterium]